MLALRHTQRPPARIAGGRRIRLRGVGETVNSREIFALFAMLAALAAFGWWVTRPPGPVPMPVPAHARTLKRPLNVFLAVDSSGSMLGPHGNDPHNTRLSDAAVLIGWMRRYVARPADELHVAEFATSLIPRVDRPLQAPGGTGLLGTAPNPTTTYFGPIVSWVRSRVQTGHAGLVIIVTDGDVPDATQALTRLHALARRVVVIQIAHRHGGTLTAAGFQVIHATTERAQAVSAAAARVVLSITGQGVKKS